MLIVQGKAKKSPLCTITSYFQCIFSIQMTQKIDPQKINPSKSVQQNMSRIWLNLKNVLQNINNYVEVLQITEIASLTNNLKSESKIYTYEIKHYFIKYFLKIRQNVSKWLKEYYFSIVNRFETKLRIAIDFYTKTSYKKTNLFTLNFIHFYGSWNLHFFWLFCVE